MPVAFDSEQELHEFVKRELDGTLSPDCIVASECVSSFGIADLVLGRVDQRKLAERRAARLGTIPTYGMCVLVATLSQARAPLSLEQLAGSSGYSRGHVRRNLLPRLLGEGHVISDEGVYHLSPHYCNPVVEITALELKLRDWKRARAQARRYQSFADRCYIVMGLTGAVTDRILSSLSNSSIGLMLATPSTVCTQKDAQYSRPIMDVDRIFVSEQVLGPLLQER